VTTTPVLEIEAAGVAYAGRPVLRDVDLSVAGGQVVALLGANGSGTSRRRPGWCR
jgi:ABC-type branched-subunit amino acid transport system ATPase component